VLRRLRQAGRRLAVVELAGHRDEDGNRLVSLAAYRALLRAVPMLARRGLVERPLGALMRQGYDQRWAAIRQAAPALQTLRRRSPHPRHH
jgi:hypothetical protein